ncbi:MAG TPA: L-serine ammonia-lyase [Bryobacteraceae bacterium]
MTASLFDIFKIGIGPSSSHTVGPMIAARRFALKMEAAGQLDSVCRVRVELYGSLAYTGNGHGTDRAVILGLCGNEPETVDPADADRLLEDVCHKGVLEVLGEYSVSFRMDTDIRFLRDRTLPSHPNGMTFTAYNFEREIVRAENFYSIGGGFVVGEEGPGDNGAAARFSLPFRNAAELLSLCAALDLAIWKLMLKNECAMRPEEEVRSGIDRIWQAMRSSIERGMTATGTLPGDLKVRRRAEGLASRLRAKTSNDPLAPLDWVSVFAIAVNEENAAAGRVVTAPTNGAAGIVPAVARYYEQFVPESSQDGILRYFLTAAAIGILYKENASISGAEVGCQGEVGVAASMAAAGLVAALDGTNEQVEHAAEIAMEHHLGMTCDPIGGLVQIPCIERNAMGAVKAINACRMAMNETEGHKISLDQVIETMYRTGLDMQSRYKETSLAGLALNVVEC